MALAPPAAAITEADVATALTALGPLPPTRDEFERAYVALHGAIRATYLAAFRALQHGQKGYVPTFSYENQPRSRVLMQAPLALNQVVVLEEATAALAADLAAARQLAAALAGRWPPRATGLLFLGAAADRARDLLIDIPGPFATAFAAFRRTAAGRLDGVRVGKAVLPAAVRDSPLAWLQVGLCHLLIVPFALQAAFAALSASALYEVDGNTGARAAATKLGGPLQDARGREAADSDLLGLRGTAGSLEQYVARLWRPLGIDVRSPREPAVRPYAQLVAELLDAELNRGGPRALKADRLGAWEEAEGKTTLEVPRHLPAGPGGGRVPFLPTWPPIVARGEYRVADKAVIMHDHPGAQLGLFVACLLYARASEYVVKNGEAPAAITPPMVTAGCLEFGGAHPPHETHRSGAEVDLDLEPDLRDLKSEGFPRKITGAGFEVDPANPDAEFWVDFKTSPFHRRWRDDLTAAIEAPRVDPRAEPFRTFKVAPWDYYGTYDPENVELGVNQSPSDTPRQVTQARAFCLSLLFSGTTNLLFADPWVFIDSFHRLRAARADFEAEANAAGFRLPARLRWPTRGAVALEPIAHFNHWHAEWKHTPAAGPPRRPGPDPAAWVPFWKALDLRLEQLTGFLGEISKGTLPAIRQTGQELAQAIARHWAEPPDDYPDLYSIVFGGRNEGDRELLRDTAHTGAKDGG